MKTILLNTGIAVAALAVAGCNSNAMEPGTTNTSTVAAADQMNSSGMTNGSDMSNSSAMASDASTTMAAPAASEFAKMAAMSDMYEIASSKLALTNATQPSLKTFAQQMIDAHNATTKGLKAAVAKDSVAMTPPASLDAEHQALVDKLKAAKGAAFDAEYKTQQTDAHTKTLAVMQSYAAGGDKPALKAFAADTAPKVKGHLDMIKAM
jgi:putative membrane protein